jgi:hypothetical protein
VHTRRIRGPSPFALFFLLRFCDRKVVRKVTKIVAQHEINLEAYFKVQVQEQSELQIEQQNIIDAFPHNMRTHAQQISAPYPPVSAYTKYSASASSALAIGPSLQRTHRRPVHTAPSLTVVPER